MRAELLPYFTEEWLGYRRFKRFAQGNRWRMWQRLVCSLSLKICLKNYLIFFDEVSSLTPTFSALLVVHQDIWVVFRLEGGD